MRVRENVSLKEFTTFKIGGLARFFVDVRTKDEFLEAVEFAKGENLKIFILSGGSNVLIDDRGFGGLVIKGNS